MDLNLCISIKVRAKGRLVLSPVNISLRRRADRMVRLDQQTSQEHVIEIGKSEKLANVPSGVGLAKDIDNSLDARSFLAC